MNIGASGFTPAGYPKAVPLALAERMKKEPFQINLWTGASVGKELDGALMEVGGIARRMPYQTNNDLRKALNAGKLEYFDLHLSHSAQMVRYGFLGGKVDVAIVEAAAIVLVVIALFLGSMRAVVIPIVTIPLSLIGQK